MELFDSHAHYNDDKFKEYKNIVNEVYNSGVTKIIVAGYSLESSKEAINMANKYEFIYATVGISPNDLEDLQEEDFLRIEELAKNKKVVAIGEIGLDYYWNKENKDEQKYAFIKQIEIANKLDLPIVIHSREAVLDTIEVLKQNKSRGVFHCCQLNMELIKEALKLEFYISFAGPITFKNSKNAKSILEYVPLEKILIETDSPYLSPEPVRGMINDSRNVKYIAQKIAEIKNISVEEIAEITYKNAERIFKIEH